MTPQEIQIIEQYKKNYGVQTDLQLLNVLLKERREFLKKIASQEILLQKAFPYTNKN